jgi:hypothetical protein
VTLTGLAGSDLPRANEDIESSALDAFMREPAAFGTGPFVISEWSVNAVLA